MSTSQDLKIIELTTRIAESYLCKNGVSVADLPPLIATIYQSLTTIANSATLEASGPAPKFSIKKTITRDYLISLEDGNLYKSLRPHLRKLGLTVEQYKEKWSLPRDYPMVAPEYAKRRSELAKAHGFGRQPLESGRSPAKEGRRRAT